VGKLVVVEGLDGSGKATLTARLCSLWADSGLRVASLAFPRYGASVYADLVREALYGRLGDLTESIHGLALLFALDRRDADALLRRLRAESDILLLDRYVASNAAYGSARLGGPAVETSFPSWVADLEVTRFGIPLPDVQILLDVPAEVARSRAENRAAGEAERQLDTFEADGGLQRRTAAMYQQLAASNYLSPWHVLQPGLDGGISLTQELSAKITA
jgi:dTMP kinase